MSDTFNEVEEEVPASEVEDLEDGQDDQGDETDEVEELTFLDIDQYRDHMVKVRVDGEDIDVPLSEAVAGFSRQADYTRKTQELAQQRAELQWATAIRGALDNDPAGTLELLKAHYGIQQQAAEQSDPLLDDSWDDDPVDKKYLEIDQRLQRFEQEQANTRLQNEVSKLSSKYGEDFDPGEVVAAAMQMGTTDLEGTYKQIAFDRLLAKQQESAQRASAAEGKRTTKRAASVVSGGTSTAKTGAGAEFGAVDSIEDAFRAAKRELGIT